MSTRINLGLVAVSLIVLGTAPPVLAQGIGSRGTTSMGTFGSRTVGSGQGLTAGSRNAFGGGGGGALGGTTGGSRIDQLIGGDSGTVDGSERYVRGNRDASAFVGSDTAESSFVGALSGGASRMQGALSGLQALRNTRDQNNNTNRNRNRSINVRTTLSIGFRYPSLKQTAIQSSTRKHLNVPTIARLGEIDVDLVDRTATLRGTVASAGDRELAVRLAQLEPGISEVVDQLTVSDSAPEAQSPSDSSF